MPAQLLPQAAAAKMLMKELAGLRKEPVEGFRLVQVDDSDVYEWNVAIFGPPGTPYENGCFKAVIKFGCEYPFQPPSFRFLTKIWHPNIYENGEVCISILHPSTNQTQGGELPEERWNPTQGVRTVIMSIISLLNEPNTFSPANVDASVMYRDMVAGKSQKYAEFCKKCVVQSQLDAAKSRIPIPRTVEEYINIGSLEVSESEMSVDTSTSRQHSDISLQSGDDNLSRRDSSQSWEFEEESGSEGSDVNSRRSSSASSFGNGETSSGDAVPNQTPAELPIDRT